MKVRELLRGTEVAHESVQQIKGLLIVPLTCDASLSLEEVYAPPCKIAWTSHQYGDVSVHNLGRRDTIIPAHTAFITKKAVQDHALSRTSVVKAGGSERHIDARCVQSTQSGTTRNSTDFRQLHLPWSIREIAWSKANTPGMSELWSTLSEFNQTAGSGAAQALSPYYQKYDKELDQFIAHFERLDNCIGFFVFFQGSLMGVEKYPSFEYTKEMWKPIVRNMYASLVIQALQARRLSQENLPEFRGTDTLKAAKRALKEYETNLRSRYVDDIKAVADMELTGRGNVVQNDVLIGDVVQKDDIYPFASLVRKNSFDPRMLRAAATVKRAAASAREFKI